MHRNKKRLYRIFAIFLAFLLAVGHLQMPGKAIRIEPEDPIRAIFFWQKPEPVTGTVKPGRMKIRTKKNQKKKRNRKSRSRRKRRSRTNRNRMRRKRQRSRIQRIIQAKILRIILMNQSQMAVSPEGRLRMKILREEISPEIMKQIQTVEMEPEIHREPERIPEIHREMEIRKMMAVRIPISRSRWNRTILIWKKVW